MQGSAGSIQVESIELEAGHSSWTTLYRIGGVAAFLMIAIVPAQIAVFMVAPPPETAIGWFELFRESPVLGLLAFELLFIIYGVLSIPMSLALYAALKRTNRSLMLIFIALTVAGTAGLFTARPAFEMLALSTRYAAATTAAQRDILLAAGEAVYTSFHGTTYLLCYILGSVTGLIVAAVMLRSKLFRKGTAYLRIASSILDFGLFVPHIGIVISASSAISLLVWNILVGRRLLQLGRASSSQ